uniref:Phytanoyl-CoA dioxygenase n=1 Tax=Chaetoceros debilis TaxID=122233 RepID=A0A7S3PVK4_9STRA|mmetsp:Transcript_25973/g.39788  ORF Transcript_25973/g.39788 Transcript_25973/m.39788 type:complete len:190 (+) Transcript_25973:154-723(+)
MVAIYRPPGAPPLAYHRDSPYFMFDPNPVATVWIALDDMAPDLGPLTYVKGSHLWGDGRVGSSQNFFEGDGGMALLYSAARRSGLGGGNTDNELKESLEFISMSGLLAGGISIHDGRTWHGSSGNISDLPRRGIGLHFVQKNVMWTEAAVKSGLWRRYVKDVIDRGESLNEIELDEEDFPVTWTPEMDK